MSIYYLPICSLCVRVISFNQKSLSPKDEWINKKRLERCNIKWICVIFRRFERGWNLRSAIKPGWELLDLFQGMCNARSLDRNRKITNTTQINDQIGLSRWHFLIAKTPFRRRRERTRVRQRPREQERTRKDEKWRGTAMKNVKEREREERKRARKSEKEKR